MDVFKFTIDNEEKEFKIKKPSLKDIKEATKVYNEAFSDALNSKATVRAKLDDVLRQQGLWNDAKQQKVSELQDELLEGERLLKKGNKNMKLSEARNVAIKMRKLRNELKTLISVRLELDTHTAEGQAEDAKNSYLISRCLVYNNTDEPYFKNYEDFLNQASSPLVLKASQVYWSIQFGGADAGEYSLPENQFLTQFKLVDDKLRLINKDGRLIDEEGKLIDEFGRYVDKDNNLVDKDGFPVDENGNYIFDFEGFIDDTTGEVISKPDEPKVETESQEILPEVQPEAVQSG